MQIIFYFSCYLLYINNLILTNTFYIISNYHYSLLIFNLLPIYPLDGSKLFNLFLAKIVSYRKAHLITIYSSYIILFLVFILLRFITFNFNIYLLLILLLFKINEGLKNHNSLFNKFLLERYMYKLKFWKTKIIKGYKINNMMRDKQHLFLIKEKYVSEKAILKKRFQKNN